MTSQIPIAALFGTDLSSRHNGAALRERIEESVRSAGIAALDFTNVRTLSESFADECFGVLVVAHGKPWFKANVKAESLATDPRQSILSAIAERLQPQAV